MPTKYVMKIYSKRHSISPGITNCKALRGWESGCAVVYYFGIAAHECRDNWNVTFTTFIIGNLFYTTNLILNHIFSHCTHQHYLNK
jgi:hypothetical protein